MELETERLRIVPLTPRQLALWVNDLPRLEGELGCSYQGEPLTGAFGRIVAGQVEAAENDGENYLWHSFWLMVRKADGVAVGAADFKNVPDGQGVVEIGYGQGEAFEHNGYMTETVRAMCAWALKQNGVKRVIAETELDGLASQRILQCCGFTQYAREETLWWELTA